MNSNMNNDTGLSVPENGSLFDILPKPWEVDAPLAPPDFEFDKPDEPQWIKDIRDPYIPECRATAGQVEASRLLCGDRAASFRRQSLEATKAALLGESVAPEGNENNDEEDDMEADATSPMAQDMVSGNISEEDVDMEDAESLPDIRAKSLFDNPGPAPRSGGLQRRKQVAPSTHQRSTVSHKQRDIFDFPEDDDEEIPDSQSEGTSQQPNPASSLPVNPEGNTIAVKNAKGQSRKRKASEGLYGTVKTIHGTKAILESIPGSKSVERLLQRGRIESPVIRIWFLCQFTGDNAAASEPVLQTALKKNKRTASLIADWDKSHK